MSFCGKQDIPDAQLVDMPGEVPTNPNAQTPYQDTPFDVSKYSDWLSSIGADQYNYAKNTYRPLEQEVIRQAQEMSGPAYAQQASDRAGASVSKAFDDRALADQEAMQAAGLGDPSQGRNRGMQRATDIARAGTLATAKNNTYNAVRTAGLQTMAGIANQGLQREQLGVGAMGTAGGLANSAYGITSGNRNYLAGLNQRAQEFNIGAKQRAQMYNAGARNQYDQQQDAGMGQMFGGIGTGIGMALPFLIPSSKKLKHHRKPHRGGLAAINKMPVQKFKYKPGVADGGAEEHIGPMAEDFKKATGVGDGKSIPVGDAIGTTMSAVQELHQRVAALEDKRRKKRNSDPESEMNQPEEVA